MAGMDIVIGVIATRRDVFSATDAQKHKNIILTKLSELGVQTVDIDDINTEGLLYDERDLHATVKKMKAADIDGVFFPHCNFGTEDLVAKAASQIGKPVLLWGPRDDAPLADGRRTRQLHEYIERSMQIYTRAFNRFTISPAGRSIHMQRILNDPDYVVDDMLKGFLKAHGDIVEATDNTRVLKSVGNPGKKVGVVTGGGSGHKPAFIGYIGKNLCDAVAVGEIFSSPTAAAFLDAFRAANRGMGVACLYGNYSGDNMNVKMAIKLAAKEGIEVKTVVANDDVASAPKEQRHMRRGVAGEVLMWKAGGAKASTGANLDDVIATAQKAIDNTRSIGIGLTPCTLPAVGHPNFEIRPGTMEVGIGHHGEPGIMVCELETASGMANRMIDIVLPDYPFVSGDEVVALVSGLGATPVMELYVLYDDIEKLLTERGLIVHRAYVGNYFTSLEMMGATLTIMKLDSELKELIDMPCYSAGLRQI